MEKTVETIQWRVGFSKGGQIFPRDLMFRLRDNCRDNHLGVCFKIEIARTFGLFFLLLKSNHFQNFHHHFFWGIFQFETYPNKPWSNITKDGGTYHPFVDRNANTYENPYYLVDDHVLW